MKQRKEYKQARDTQKEDRLNLLYGLVADRNRD